MNSTEHFLIGMLGNVLNRRDEGNMKLNIIQYHPGNGNGKLRTFPGLHSQSNREDYEKKVIDSENSFDHRQIKYNAKSENYGNGNFF